MKDTELKACPNCGSKETKTSDKAIPWPHCTACGLEIYFRPDSQEQNKRTAELWNRWSTLEAQERYREELKRVYPYGQAPREGIAEVYDSGEDFMLRDEQLKKLEGVLFRGLSKGIMRGFEQARVAWERDGFWEGVFSKVVQNTPKCSADDTGAELTLGQLLDRHEQDWRRIAPNTFLSDRNEMIKVKGLVVYYYENMLDRDFIVSPIPKTMDDLKWLIDGT